MTNYDSRAAAGFVYGNCTRRLFYVVGLTSGGISLMLLYVIIVVLLGIYALNLYLTIKQYVKVKKLRREQEIVSPKDTSYLSSLIIRTVTLTLGLAVGGVCLIV